MKVVHLSKRKITFQLAVLILCVFLGWELKTRFTPKSDADWHAQVPYVVTADAVLETVAPQKKYIATVESVNGVDVKAQVTGYLDKVLFKEGAFVQKDRLLFVIEQSRYQEAVNSADAEVSRAKANLKEIENDHKRNIVLFEQKVLTASAIEASESALSQAKAAVKAASVCAFCSSALFATAFNSSVKLSKDDSELSAVFKTEIACPMPSDSPDRSFAR